MAKGTIYRSESKAFFDEETGTKIRQVTDYPSIHHHPFYYLPCFDNVQQRLFFVSHRTGRPEIFAEIQDTLCLVQLTEHEGLNEWSVHPSHDGHYVYFTTAMGAWRLNTETLEEEELFNFEKIAVRDKGMVGASMGTTTLSHDDAFWAIPIKAGDVYRFYNTSPSVIRSFIHQTTPCCVSLDLSTNGFGWSTGMEVANGSSIGAEHIEAIPSERNGLYMRHGVRARVRLSQQTGRMV
jgi:hypothetical protein